MIKIVTDCWATTAHVSWLAGACKQWKINPGRCLLCVGLDAGYERRAIATALVSVVVVAVLIIVVFTAVRLYLMRRHSDPDTTDEAGTDSSAAFLAGCDSVSAAGRSTGPDLDGLKIDQLISHGRYGDVYRGLLGASEVAVKVNLMIWCLVQLRFLSIYIKLPRLSVCVCVPDFSKTCRPIFMKLFMVHKGHRQT